MLNDARPILLAQYILDMPDMKEARLLGTPVQRNAPRAASPLQQSQSVNEVSLSSPVRLSYQVKVSSAVLHADVLSRPTQPASPTLSGTSRQPSSSPAPPQRPQPSAADLKAAAAAAIARTRIQADPSISSAFRREDDEELWELFTR